MSESNELLSAGAQLIGMPLAGPESFSEQQLTYLKRALGVDETVLWEGTLSNTTGTGTLSEATGNFERIKVYIQPTGVTGQSIVVHELSLVYRSANGNDALAYVPAYEKHSNVTTQNMVYIHFTGAYGTGVKLESGSKWVGSEFTEGVTTYNFALVKVVGINRIAGGN